MGEEAVHSIEIFPFPGRKYSRILNMKLAAEDHASK